MYRGYRETVDFSVLKGKTITAIDNQGDVLKFATSDGGLYQQIYYSDCCASCDVEEIHGDLEDLIGTPVLMAEEVSSGEPSFEVQAERTAKKEKEKAECLAEGRKYYEWSADSETWTFYKIATIKGSVTIRWYGSSNGYYSETPTFEQLKGDKS